MSTANPTGSDHERARAASVVLANPEVFDDPRRSAASGPRLRWGVSTLMAAGLLLTLGIFWWLLLAGRPQGARAAGAISDVPALTLSGSGTIGAELAPALAEGFLKDKGATGVRREDGAGEVVVTGTLPGAAAPSRIAIRSGGSREAFVDLARGTADIGMASRPVQAGDLAGGSASLAEMTSPAVERVLGMDGLAVVVHPYNPVRALTLGQLRDIWSGRIRDWSEVGGSRGAIAVYSPEERSGAFETLQSLVLGDRRLALSARRVADAKELSEAVSGDLGGIGLVGMPLIGDNKALEISQGGAAALAPTALSVRTEDYPLARRLYLYARPKGESSWIAEFLDFALSDAGQKIVEESGFVGQALAGDDVAPYRIAGAELPAPYARRTGGASRVPLNFRFRSGSEDLDNKALADLDRLAAFLKDPANQSRPVLLLGFTDSVGEEGENRQLSNARAQAVGEQLAAKGISAVETEGFGEALPVATNEAEPGRRKNRRVEVWLGAPPAPPAVAALAVPAPPAPVPAPVAPPARAAAGATNP